MEEPAPLFETTTEIRIWRTLADMSAGLWVFQVFWLVAAVGLLAAIGYAVYGAFAYTGLKTIWVVLALVPWWLLFGAPSLGFVRTLARGGEELWIRINRYGVIGVSGSENGPVRCIDDVRLLETVESVILQSVTGPDIAIALEEIVMEKLGRLKRAVEGYEDERLRRQPRAS